MGSGFSNIYFKSNEVKNSSWMELEGLKRTVTTLKDAGLSIRTLITDRHKQIGSYVKKELHDTSIITTSVAQLRYPICAEQSRAFSYWGMLTRCAGHAG